MEMMWSDLEIGDKIKYTSDFKAFVKSSIKNHTTSIIRGLKLEYIFEIEYIHFSNLGKIMILFKDSDWTIGKCIRDISIDGKLCKDIGFSGQVYEIVEVG